MKCFVQQVTPGLERGKSRGKEGLEKKIGNDWRLSPPTGQGYQAKTSHPVRMLAVDEERSLLWGNSIIARHLGFHKFSPRLQDPIKVKGGKGKQKHT